MVFELPLIVNCRSVDADVIQTLCDGAVDFRVLWVVFATRAVVGVGDSIVVVYDAFEQTLIRSDPANINVNKRLTRRRSFIDQ